MKRITRPALRLCLLSAALCFTACSTPSKTELYEKQSAQQIYTSGLKHLKAFRYQEAIADFEALESHYPFGEYTDRSQLGEIYAHYEQNEHPEALASADRFIRQHPKHPHIDYVYYIKGLVHFTESIGFIAKYFPMERSERDTKAATEAFEAFDELIQKFPHSKYYTDAKKRQVYLYTVLAENELHAARYYLKRGAFIAAANRATTLMERFPQSPCLQEALAIQIQAYRHLQCFDLANDTLKILRLNYPHSTHLKSL